MKCKICQSSSQQLAEALVLKRYQVNYFQCSHCGFVQTEDPYWLEEAYRDAIAGSDVGLVYRNNLLTRLSKIIIFNFFDHTGQFLDFGGGYGLFVRMMRDFGFDFYWDDKYCQNLLARGFEAQQNLSQTYELVTTFEVFEHLVNPLEEIAKILEYSPNLLFSTQLLPSTNPKPDEWWYYSLDEGQHIALYTLESLEIIAQKFNLNLYSDSHSIHLLTSKKLPQNCLKEIEKYAESYFDKKSLIQQDYYKITGQSNFEIIDTSHEEKSELQPVKTGFKVAVDGVFFQYYKTGIARVWESLLKEWVNNGFAEYIIVLDREETTPKISGINYITIPAHNYNHLEKDHLVLQRICEQEKVSLFISTYYTRPLSTPSVFMAYDMIPEVGRWDLNTPMWQEKHQAIAAACRYIAISENTAQDLVNFFPQINPDLVTVAHCGVAEIFAPSNLDKINQFKKKYGIDKPYFLIVGGSQGYKNTILFLKAFSQLPSKEGFDILCTGSMGNIDENWRQYTEGSTFHLLRLSDEDLISAYSGAIALVFPSQYEGFGLPILEAMACGCPVITCPKASIPEVAGEAAIYIPDDNVETLAETLYEVQKPRIRQQLISKGLERAKQFSWKKMSQIISSILVETTLQNLNLKPINLIIFPDWSTDEDLLQSELTQLIAALISHTDKSQITLLVDTHDVDSEEVNLFLSNLMLILIMEQGVEIDEDLSIITLEPLADIQLQTLLPRIHSRIVLESDNQAIISQLNFDKIPTTCLTNLRNMGLISSNVEI